MHPQLQLLVALQDLEQMIAEAEDQAKAEQEEGMGFNLEGLDDLKKAREDLESQIEPAHRNYFRRLTKSFGHAVVPVIGNLCMGCFANIPASFVSVTNENRVQKCENCGRILYWP